VRPDLSLRVARLGRFLRREGLPVALSDEIDAGRALALLPGSDREELRLVLRSALRIRREDWERFDALLEAFLSERARRRRRVARPAGRGAALGRGRADTAPEGAGGADRPASGAPAYSPVALLVKGAPRDCSERELGEMERVLSRLARRLARRRSRRLVPTRGPGRPDPRRSLRHALASGGELVAFARRTRARDEPRLVFLCDTSGSMDAHARFLLAFAVALRRVARATEVFAFNTSLVRITPSLGRAPLAATLERVREAVPGWSGGTRIGASLSEFVAGHLQGRVGARTVVVILSDGLDRGDPRALASAMSAIRERAGKVVWLNPLLSDPRYQPTARGMAAALPYVHDFLPAHDLASLERLLPRLAA